MTVSENTTRTIEMERNLRAIKHAVAQQSLEGLTVSDSTIEDMRRAAMGEISQDEVIRNIYARYSACPDTPNMTPTSIPPRAS